VALSGESKTLVTGLVVALASGLLFTPLGPSEYETRSAPSVTPIGGNGVDSLLAGLVLSVASIVLLFRKARAALVLVIVGLLFFPLLLLDLSRNFSPEPPTPVIADLELVTIGVAMAVLFLASRVYRESTTKS
jgi:hypothetical protein